MIDYQLITSVFVGIAVLLLLIIALKLNAFISLLISSVVVGVMAGMEFNAITDAISRGMGGTLGYVAIVVGLGAIFGAILEKSGGANGLANFLIQKFGDNKARLAVLIAGFIIAIPVFFDVAFIILIPVLQALSNRTKKTVVYFALPLLAGLAITHSLIPPTPGPVAVADIINVDLGWVIIFGTITGIPTAIVSGLWFSRLASSKIKSEVHEAETDDHQSLDTSIVPLVLTIIAVPILLIVTGTIIKMNANPDLSPGVVENVFVFLGHPFVALIIATILALYLLGNVKGYSRQELFDLSNKSLAPAGSIILITGAGGVFKQMLIETGTGTMIAQLFEGSGATFVIPLAFVVAALVRMLQGSATVAMITAAGVIAPIMSGLDFPDVQKALVVLSIAAGSVFLSHVNDSGFWLVNRYLNLTVQDTLKSWSALTVVIGLTSFTIIFLISLFV